MVVAKAQASIKEALSKRTDAGVAHILQSARVEAPRLESALTVITRLADVLGIRPGQLRAGDRLAAILRVPRASIDVSDEVWSKAGFGASIEVFGYDILEAMEKLSTRKAWEAQWRQLVPRPRNEEEWIDLIMNMDVGEFLRFFTETL